MVPMRMRSGWVLVVAVSLVVLMTCCHSGDAMFSQFIRKSQALEKHNARIERLAAEQGIEPAQPQWFTQILDHFNHQDNRTWQQLYYVNDTFYNYDIGGPIFFQFGGEAPISPAWVSFFEYASYAQKFGAMIVCLEHRFYGSSAPLPDLSTPNLQYLSSQQSLADAATFITWFKKSLNATNTPVVTFGCSYPGNLAAWFRLKYSHITDMSIASSSPVQATEDFFQYLDVVDRSLQYFTGETCIDIISNATAQIESLLQTQEGQLQLQRLFNTCTPLNNSQDIMTFMSNLMGNWMTTVQYNMEEGYTVDELCGLLYNFSSNGTNPLAGYAAVSLLFNDNECQVVSYEAQLALFQNLSQANPYAAMRSWVYQTCTQFGYFQTTDSTQQPFGNLVPLSSQLQMCTDIYGQQFDTLNLIDETNIYYGGNENLKNGPTNILFVNGNVDPWHVLGVTETLSPSLPAILIDGTAHCANVEPPAPTDPIGLTEARIQIMQTISEWLSAL